MAMASPHLHEYKGNMSECKLELHSLPSANRIARFVFRVKRFQLEVPAPDGGYYKFKEHSISYVRHGFVNKPSVHVPETIARSFKIYLAKFVHDECALEFAKDKISNYLKARRPDSEHETLVANVETRSILLDMDAFKKAYLTLIWMKSCCECDAPAMKEDVKEDNGSLEETCAICFEDLQVGFTLETPCNHEFHHCCIISWFATHKMSCPICRRHLKIITNK